MKTLDSGVLHFVTPAQYKCSVLSNRRAGHNPCSNYIKVRFLKQFSNHNFRETYLPICAQANGSTACGSTLFLGPH